MLVRLAFWVASPALLLTVVADADVHDVFSANLVASAGAVAGSLLLYLVLSRVVARRPGPETVVGSLCSMYVNAGNLGIPIAAYVLGDAAFVADRKSTRLNSSHVAISYAVFCLKKKKKRTRRTTSLLPKDTDS